MKPGQLVRIIVPGMGGAQEVVRLVDDFNGRTVVTPLHSEHRAWFGTGKRQAQWKRERGPIGRRR